MLKCTAIFTIETGVDDGITKTVEGWKNNNKDATDNLMVM